jgi:large subunit ribosomal protein L25
MQVKSTGFPPIRNDPKRENLSIGTKADPCGPEAFQGRKIMPDEVHLQAAKRTSVGNGLFSLRRSGRIPGILYGPGIDSIPIEMNAVEAARILNGMTGSTLIHLNVDQKEYPVLLRDMQRDSIRRTILHVDFYAVPTDRSIRVRVPLVFTGESGAVRDFAGILVHLLSDLEVECLPKDLVNEISVDLSSLEKIGDSITIKDIALPPGIKVLMNLEENIVTVTAQREEEEPAVVAAAEAPAEVEVIEKGKKLEEGEEVEEKEQEKEKEKPKEAREGKK